MKLVHVNQFLDNVTLQFRNFLENKNFFQNEAYCNCLKCVLFGYEGLNKLSRDVILTSESLIELLNYLKEIKHFEQDPGSKVYISRFLHIFHSVRLLRFFLSK